MIGFQKTSILPYGSLCLTAPPYCRLFCDYLYLPTWPVCPLLLATLPCSPGCFISIPQNWLIKYLCFTLISGWQRLPPVPSTPPSLSPSLSPSQSQEAPGGHLLQGLHHQGVELPDQGHGARQEVQGGAIQVPVEKSNLSNIFEHETIIYLFWAYVPWPFLFNYQTRRSQGLLYKHCCY